MRRRHERLVQQRHPRLLRRPVGLAVVVLGAGRDGIQPAVPAPWARGTTWSTVVALLPQYAHRCWSLTSTPRLDHGACLRNGTRTYRQSLITRGTGRSTAAPRTRSSGWACSTTALSCRTSTTARLSVTVESGSKLALSTSVSRIVPTSRVPAPSRSGAWGLDQRWPSRPGSDNAIFPAKQKMPASDLSKTRSGQTTNERSDRRGSRVLTDQLGTAQRVEPQVEADRRRMTRRCRARASRCPPRTR